MKKTAISVLLVLCMLLAMLPAAAVGQQEAVITRNYSGVNPMYEDLPEAEPAEVSEPLSLQGTDAYEYDTDICAVADKLRQAMVERQTKVYLYYKLPAASDCKWEDILYLALSHTMNPKEGDYLLYHLKSYDVVAIGTPNTAGDVIRWELEGNFSYISNIVQEEKVDAAIETLHSQIYRPGMTNEELVQKIYDYICTNVRYAADTEPALVHSAYAALINKESVCQGYATLFYRLALREGIDCRIVGGSSKKDVKHAWNIVRLDTNSPYYTCVDSTWDESRTSDKYRYYLKGETAFSADHTRDKEYAGAAFSGRYPTAADDYSPNSQESTVNGFSSKLNKLYLTGISSNYEVLCRSARITLSFNRNVKAGSGKLHIYSKSNQAQVCTVDSSALTFDGGRAILLLAPLDLPDGDYYACIDAGAIVGTDGTKFCGLPDKTSWNFSVQALLPCTTLESMRSDGGISGALLETHDGITRQYAVQQYPGWQADSVGKPAIPAGTGEEYTRALKKWLNMYGINDVPEAAMAGILDDPMYLPVMDHEAQTVLLDDGGTTVQQTMEDIVFLEALQLYVQQVEKQIGTGRQAAYLDAMNCCGQIISYLESRNAGSNLILSASAPAAYEYLIEDTSDPTERYRAFRYCDEYPAAALKSRLVQEDLTALSQYDDYAQIRQAAKSIGETYGDGDILYYADGQDEQFSLDTDVLIDSYGASFHPVLSEIAFAWTNLTEGTTPWELAAALNHSLCGTPVPDFSHTSFAGTGLETAAWWFFGAYYVAEQYPSLYETMFGENLSDIDREKAAKLAEKSGDDAVKDWYAAFLGFTEQELTEDSRRLWLDLTDYALLLRFVRDYDVGAAKMWLASFVSAEQHKPTLAACEEDTAAEPQLMAQTVGTIERITIAVGDRCRIVAFGSADRRISDHPGVVGVDQNGKVYGISEGTALVSAYTGNTLKSIMITVVPSSAPVTLYPCDAGTPQIKIDVLHGSCTVGAGKAIVAIYESGRFVKAQTVDIKETPGETTTAYLPFAGTAGKSYTAKIFLTDSVYAPIGPPLNGQLAY